MAKKEIIDNIKEYISLLRAEGILIDKAFLYGSYMHGKATDESDIDLMIITEQEQDDYNAGKIWSLTKKVNSRIEPFLIGKGRFYSDNDSPLIEKVKRTGLEIG